MWYLWRIYFGWWIVSATEPCSHHGFWRSTPVVCLIIMVYLLTVLIVSFLVVNLAFQFTLLHSMLIRSSHFHHGFGMLTLVAYLIIMVSLLAVFLITVLAIHLTFQITILHSMLIRASHFHLSFGRLTTLAYLIIIFSHWFWKVDNIGLLDYHGLSAYDFS